MPALAEEGEVIIGHDLPLPLIGVLREQSDGAGADLDGAPERGVQASACRHVRAEEIAVLGREAEAGHGPAITCRTLPVIPSLFAARAPKLSRNHQTTMPLTPTLSRRERAIERRDLHVPLLR